MDTSNRHKFVRSADKLAQSSFTESPRTGASVGRDYVDPPERTQSPDLSSLQRSRASDQQKAKHEATVHRISKAYGPV